MPHSWVGFWPYSPNFRLDWSGLLGTNTSSFVNYKHKMFLKGSIFVLWIFFSLSCNGLGYKFSILIGLVQLFHFGMTSIPGNAATIHLTNGDENSPFLSTTIACFIICSRRLFSSAVVDARRRFKSAFSSSSDAVSDVRSLTSRRSRSTSSQERLKSISTVSSRRTVFS
jgi:hypothetical protein